MKYNFTITAEVEITAENVAQAFKHAKRLRLIPSRERAKTGEEWMTSGTSRTVKDRQSIRHSVRQKSLKVHLEGIR